MIINILVYRLCNCNVTIVYFFKFQNVFSYVFPLCLYIQGIFLWYVFFDNIQIYFLDGGFNSVRCDW